jgi:hypothetical protein
MIPAATIESLADWFARSFGDAKTRADVAAGEAIYKFWTEPSSSSKAAMVAAVEAAIGANAAAIRSGAAIAADASKGPMNDDLVGAEIAGPNAANRR